MTSGIETSFVEANGLRFETQKAGSGDRFALCLHGFPEHAWSWRFQLPLLAELGFTAWAPNLRGYGQTSRPPRAADYLLERLVEDAEALFVAAAERGVRERVLIGHDWGALIAWAVAMEGRLPLDKLVILNVPHPALMARGLRRWAQLRKSWYMAFFQLPWLPERMLGARGAEAVTRALRGRANDKTNFTPDDLAVFTRNALQPGALTAMVNYYRALPVSPLMRRLARADAAPITVKTLMIWGEDDHALGKELTYGTEDYVRDLTVRYLPGVSHWVQQEAPQLVNPMLRAFLEGRTVPAAAQL